VPGESSAPAARAGDIVFTFAVELVLATGLALLLLIGVLYFFGFILIGHPTLGGDVNIIIYYTMSREKYLKIIKRAQGETVGSTTIHGVLKGGKLSLNKNLNKKQQ